MGLCLGGLGLAVLLDEREVKGGKQKSEINAWDGE